MKKMNYRTLLIAALGLLAPVDAVAKWWPVETPEGVKEAGLLEVMSTPVTSEGGYVACQVLRNPVLKQEWIFNDLFHCYEWSPFAGDFAYVGDTNAPKVRIRYVASVLEKWSAEIQVREARSIYHTSGDRETSTAYSYGEGEVTGFKL